MLSITEAIVSYAVSAKADSSAWVKLSIEISNLCVNTGSDMDVLKSIIKNQEEEYKKAYDEKQLPPAYRSAKSVALKAIANGVSLRNDVGEPYGKTAVEKAIKDAVGKKEDVPKNLLQEWNKFSDQWYNPDIDADKSDRDYVVSCMKGIIESYEA